MSDDFDPGGSMGVPGGGIEGRAGRLIVLIIFVVIAIFFIWFIGTTFLDLW